MPYAGHGIMPWLAFDSLVTDDLYSRLPESWGLLRVTGHRVKALRRPQRVYDPDPVNSMTAIASVVCMQQMPMMMGKTHGQQLEALVREDFPRPWRHWLEDDETSIEEPGHML
jgi:hypothetical protein